MCDDLRRNVVGLNQRKCYCPNYLFFSFLLQLSLQVFLPFDGKSEIDELDVGGILCEEKKILRLEVAMRYLDAV